MRSLDIDCAKNCAKFIVKHDILEIRIFNYFLFFHWQMYYSEVAKFQQ